MASKEIDPVDNALSTALQAAATAGRFDVVATLAGELQARRVAREAGSSPAPLGNVLDLAAARKARG